MLTKIFSACFLVSVFLSACNGGENTNNKQIEQANDQKFDSTDIKKDVDFTMSAAAGGMMEVELGGIAKTNAGSASVKAFGEQMVNDHSKANAELKAIADSKNISLPSVPDNAMQHDIDDLKQKHGKDFDKAYIDLMVSDHKKDIKEFQEQADKGNDPKIKTWAAEKIATLQHHLKMAEGIQNELAKAN